MEDQSMELEYEVKIARPAQALAFDSVEKEAAFVLLLYLPGEKRAGLQVEVSEDGRELSISGGGGGSTAELQITRGTRLHREEEVAGFRKVFRIPEGVDAQGVEAEYDEDERLLLVYLPKLRTGAPGGAGRIEEIKEEEKAAKGIEIPQEPESSHDGKGTSLPMKLEAEVIEEEIPMAEEGIQEKEIVLEQQPEEEEEEKTTEGEPPGTARRQRPRWRGLRPFRTPLLLAGSAAFFTVLMLAFRALRSRRRAP